MDKIIREANILFEKYAEDPRKIQVNMASLSLDRFKKVISEANIDRMKADILKGNFKEAELFVVDIQTAFTALDRAIKKLKGTT